jgi:Condensation domain
VALVLGSTLGQRADGDPGSHSVGDVDRELLSPAKQAVLARWRDGRLTADQRGADGPQLTANQRIEHDPRRTRFPLSVRQRVAWSFELLSPANPANTLFFCASVRGFLDESALREALWMLVDRHAILRTVIDGAPGHEQQVVLANIATVLDIVDLTDRRAEDGQRQAVAHAQAVIAQGFDVRHGPLMRMVLYRLGDESRILVLQIHHIVADGWSFGVALFELRSIYESLVDGRDPALPPLAIQYGDFSVWEHEWLRTQDLTALGQYWGPRLRGAPALALGYDHPAGDRRDISGASIDMVLGEAIASAMRRVGRECGATTFMCLAAGIAVLCHALSGATDVAIEAVLANRVLPETQGLIGMFINNLPLRVDLSGDPTFRELLSRVQTMCTAAYATQQVPLEALLESLDIDHASDGTPIAQVELVFQNWPVPAMRLGSAEFERLELDQAFSFHDLEFHLWDGPVIEGRVAYKTALFEEESVHRKLHALQRILSDATSSPDRRLSDLIGARPPERR